MNKLPGTCPVCGCKTIEVSEIAGVHPSMLKVVERDRYTTVVIDLEPGTDFYVEALSQAHFTKVARAAGKGEISY